MLSGSQLIFKMALGPGRERNHNAGSTFATAQSRRMEQHLKSLGIPGGERSQLMKVGDGQVVYNDGAGGGGRTHMLSEERGILSPVGPRTGAKQNA